MRQRRKRLVAQMVVELTVFVRLVDAQFTVSGWSGSLGSAVLLGRRVFQVNRWTTATHSLEDTGRLGIIRNLVLVRFLNLGSVLADGCRIDIGQVSRMTIDGRR
jgi:hypothetical protein